MQADLMQKTLSIDPPVAITGGQLSPFTVQPIVTASDTLVYKVDFGLNDVKYQAYGIGPVIDYGPCTGTLTMTYTKAADAWNFSNVAPAQKLSCPTYEAAQAREQQQEQQQQAAAHAQQCALRQSNAYQAAATNCQNDHIDCDFHYTPDPDCR